LLAEKVFHQDLRSFTARIRARYHRHPLAYALLASAVALPFYFIFIARSSFTVNGTRYYSLFDDAMISMRYARNLAQGLGIVWNPGEHVEGYTNFLWTLWMAGVHVMPVPDSKTSLLIMLSGVAILVANLFVVGALVRRLAPGSGLALLVAVSLTAFYFPLVFWTLRGMEVGLAALLISAMALQSLRVQEISSTGRLAGLAALSAAAILTRDELLIPALIVGAFTVFGVRDVRRVKVGAILAGTLGVTIGFHDVFRLFYYGDLLPNTYYLKLDGSTLGQRAPRGLVSVGWSVFYELGLCLVIALAGILARGSRPPGRSLLVALFAGQLLYSIYVGADAWETLDVANRYITPGAPALFVLAAAGLDSVASREHLTRAARLVLAIIVAGLFGVSVLVALTTLAARHPVSHFLAAQSVIRIALVAIAAGAFLATTPRRGSARDPSPPRKRASVGVALLAASVLGSVGVLTHTDIIRGTNYEMMARIGVALRRYTPKDTSLAVVRAGALPYFSRRRAIDLLGKSDAVVARGPVKGAFLPGHNKWNYRHSILDLKPDVVLELRKAKRQDYAMLRASGYRPLPPAFAEGSACSVLQDRWRSRIWTFPRLLGPLERMCRSPMLRSALPSAYESCGAPSGARASVVCRRR
jgi:arabinofuranosyltransferase